MITVEDIEKAASLSRLGLSAAELESMAKDVGNILQHFTAIQKIDTSDTAATDDASGLKNVSRADEVKQFGDPSELVAAAPQTHENQLKVSAVFEE